MQYFSFRDVLFYEVAFTVPLDLSTDAMTVVMCSSLGVFPPISVLIGDFRAGVKHMQKMSLHFPAYQSQPSCFYCMKLMEKCS